MISSLLSSTTPKKHAMVVVGAGQMARAMVAGMRAAAGPDIPAIAAGNYGGKLGKHHFALRELLAAVP